MANDLQRNQEVGPDADFIEDYRIASELVRRGLRVNLARFLVPNLSRAKLKQLFEVFNDTGGVGQRPGYATYFMQNRAAHAQLSMVVKIYLGMESEEYRDEHTIDPEALISAHDISRIALGELPTKGMMSVFYGIRDLKNEDAWLEYCESCSTDFLRHLRLRRNIYCPYCSMTASERSNRDSARAAVHELSHAGSDNTPQLPPLSQQGNVGVTEDDAHTMDASCSHNHSL